MTLTVSLRIVSIALVVVGCGRAPDPAPAIDGAAADGDVTSVSRSTRAAAFEVGPLVGDHVPSGFAVHDSTEDDPFMSTTSEQLGTTSSVTLRRDPEGADPESTRVPWLRVTVIEHGQGLDTSVASARRGYSSGIGPTYDEIAVNDHEALLVTSPGSRSLTVMWSASEDTAVRIHGFDVDDDVVVRIAEGIHR